MKEIISKIPEKIGVYFFIGDDNEILYIGKSVNLKKRIKSHFRNGSNKIFKRVERDNFKEDNRIPMFTWDYTAKYLEKVPSLVFNKQQRKKRNIKNKTNSIRYILTDTEEEALTLEGCLISTIRPKFNRMLWKYPFIEVTLAEEVPRILTAYQILDPESYIYGPFNVAANIDLAIDGFLMFYPLCVHHKPVNLSSRRSPNCIKYQINRCLAPCINSDLLLQYHEIIQKFIFELEDNGRNVIQQLEAKMLVETRNQNFEGAAIIRDRMNAISELFSQKAIPVVLQKYYTDVKEILDTQLNFVEIIDKIITNNNLVRK